MRRRILTMGVVTIAISVGALTFCAEEKPREVARDDERSEARGLFASWFGRAPSAGESPSASPTKATKRDLRGRVIDALDKTPIAGARVTLRGKGDVAETTSDPEGRFAFGDTLQAYGISATANGYAALGKRLSSFREELVLELEEAIVVSGTAVDGGGLPVEGAEIWVTIHNRNEWPPVESERVTTGSDGAFTIKDAPNGNLVVNAEHAKLADGSKYLGGIGAGGRRDGVVVTLGAAAIVSGVVKDETGNAVPDAVVQWREDKRRVFDIDETTTTAADGTFILYVPPAEEGVLSATSANHGEAVADVRVDLAGDNRFELTLRLPPATSGKVVDDAGAPVGGATIEASGMRADRTSARAESVSGEDGSFSLRIGSIASITLIAKKDGRMVRAYGRSGQSDVILVLGAQGRLRLSVVGPDGEPARYVQYWATLANGDRLHVDDDVWVGTPGDWFVHLTHVGESSSEKTAVTVAAAPPETIHVITVTPRELSLRASVLGRFVDAGGKPIAGVRVSEARPAYPGKPENRSAFFQRESSTLGNRAGRFTLTTTGGAKRLFAFHPEFRSQVVDALVPPTGEVDIGTITLERGQSSESYVEGIGIGILITTGDDDKGCAILNAFPGEPADVAGLRARDVLLSANGVTLVGIPFSECGKHLKGEEGKPIELVVRRGKDKPFTVSIAPAKYRR